MYPEAESREALRARLCKDFGNEPEGESPALENPEAPSALDTQINGNHYKNFEIQPAVFIDRNNLPFLEGCVIKRMCRHESKDRIADLRKAIHEIQLIIEIRYGVKP